MAEDARIRASERTRCRHSSRTARPREGAGLQDQAGWCSSVPPDESPRPDEHRSSAGAGQEAPASDQIDAAAAGLGLHPPDGPNGWAIWHSSRSAVSFGATVINSLCRSARGPGCSARQTGVVRLELTNRGSYAIRAVITLAWRDPTEYVPAREIAREVSIPVRFVPQVLGDLNRAGLLEARLGRSGGHRLARPASTISLLDAIKAAEGDTRRQPCVLTGIPCRTSHESCEVHALFADAEAALLGRLDGTSVAEVIDADAGAWLAAEGVNTSFGTLPRSTP